MLRRVEMRALLSIGGVRLLDWSLISVIREDTTLDGTCYLNWVR